MAASGWATPRRVGGRQALWLPPPRPRRYLLQPPLGARLCIYAPCASAPSLPWPGTLRRLQDRFLALMEEFGVAKFPTPAPPGRVIQWRYGQEQDATDEEVADYEGVGN